MYLPGVGGCGDGFGTGLGLGPGTGLGTGLGDGVDVGARMVGEEVVDSEEHDVEMPLHLL